jgi:preprotein translocase subunit SecG
MSALLIIQILVSLALIGVVVLQAKGTGLGRSFGSTTYHAKRGMEKTLFIVTIALAVIFVGLAMFIAL